MSKTIRIERDRVADNRAKRVSRDIKARQYAECIEEQKASLRDRNIVQYTRYNKGINL